MMNKFRGEQMIEKQSKKDEVSDPIIKDELTDDDIEHIREVFFEMIVPKLKNSHARLGTLNCEFAGEQYKCWNILFKSVGSDFDIVDFEYDEEGSGLDLDL
jgi:hypothetical protein